MKQLVEMIRAARDYRWVGIYKIIKNEFVIMAETGERARNVSAFSNYSGLVRCGPGFGQTDHRRRREQGCSLSACVSHYSFGDHRADAQRPPAHSRYARCRQR